MNIPSIKITPLLYVDSVEKSLPFWQGQLGFEKVIDMTEDGEILFMLLKHGEQELMLNSRKLTRKTQPKLADYTNASAAIYLDVESLKPILAAVEQSPKLDVVVPEHKTDYGTREIILREPEGNLVWFAAHE